MNMTKRQAERYYRMREALMACGVTQAEVDALLRRERTLSRWDCAECNGEIQRDETTDKPYAYNTNTGSLLGRIADREAGAMRRADAICKAHGLTAYHQGDPRGCSLYVIRPGDVRDGAKPGECYTNGIAVCID